MRYIMLALAVAALAVTGASFAASEDASPCGVSHGAFANDNGSFGWLGDVGGAAGYHGATGQEPGATGYNNSHTGCQG